MPVLLTPSIALAALLSPPARRTITPGWWSIDEQASFSDARAAHQLYGLDAAPERDRHKYFCDVCNRGFDRQKQLDEHLVGRPHAAALIEGDQAVSAWRRSAWFDANVTDDAVASRWLLDAFLHGLPVRSRSRGGPRVQTLQSGVESGMLSPKVTVASLAPTKRTMLWRYLWSIHPQLPEVVAALPPRFARVKELLESCEVAQLVKRALTRAPAASRASTLYDVACGHGLVGHLLACILAAEGEPIRVVSIDRVRRPAFDAWAAAFDEHAQGSSAHGVTFTEGNFQEVLLDGITAQAMDPDSVVLCVHGCNEVNVDAVRAARRRGAGWVLVPCCLQSAPYLPALESLHVSDEARYQLLVGAMASQYEAEFLWSVDKRITPRSLVLGAV